MQNLAVQQGANNNNNNNAFISFKSEVLFYVFRPESRWCPTIRINVIRWSIIGSSVCYAKHGNAPCETIIIRIQHMNSISSFPTVGCSPAKLCFRRGEELKINSNNKLCHTYTHTHTHKHTHRYLLQANTNIHAGMMSNAGASVHLGIHRTYFCTTFYCIN